MMSVSSSGSASGSTGYGSSSRSIGYESMLYESHVATVGVKGRSNSSMQVVDGDRYIYEFFEEVLCCKSINDKQNFIPMDVSSPFWKDVIITLNDLNIKSNGIICKLLQDIKRNLGSVKLNIGHIDHYKN